MRKKIATLGRPRLLALITLVALIASVTISVVINKMLGRAVDGGGIFIAIAAPIIIAPSIGWYLIGLMMRIHQLEEEARAIATFDMLTGLLTRRAFLNNCESAFQIARRNKSPLSVIYVDLDNFKQLNDTYGHGGGDEVLRFLGSTINKFKRASDLAGRIGGEEFALAFPNTNLDGAIHMAEKLCQKARSSHVAYENTLIEFTVSIGVHASGQTDEADLYQILKHADEALYQAKRAGKDRVIAYKEEPGSVSSR
ncbi:MAG: GGDEF domain-containing protein [Sulfuritalea sp.]|nr:GGDEF domain-containing protein [Sulfuritalea sp.]